MGGGAKRVQEGLQRRSAYAEEDQHVHDKELVVSRHNAVVERRERRDRVRLLCDEEKDERDEERQECNKQGGDERLYHFALPLVVVEVCFLCGVEKSVFEAGATVMLTRLGQNREMFWIETRPTRRETGKSQNSVKAL